MTTRIKILLISLLSALCALCMAALALPSFFAKADTVEITTTSISDNNFSFVPGAAASTLIFKEGTDPSAENFDLATAQTQLRFTFKLENFNYENLADSVSHAHPWYTNMPSPNVFMYEFTLLRGNQDGDGAGNLGTAVEQYSILIVLFPDSNKNFYGYIAEKSYYTGSSISGIFLEGNEIPKNYGNYDTDYEDIATKGDYYNWENVRRYFGKGYTITKRIKISDNKNNLAFTQNDGLILNMSANLNSPFSYYCIKSRYCYNISYDSMSNTRTIAYGEIYSSSRSFANVLYRMNEAGVDFNETFEDRAIYANQILAAHNTQHVRIKYLTEIEGTPYATHNYAYVDVPVWAETIYISDVEQALGISLRKCLDSNAYCFQKTTDTDGELYQLYYLKNVWLRSATVDGKYFDYFLDINDSYKDVYRPYVNSGILTNDVYEWVYSTQILNKFPALQDYRFNEIYGYFGLVVVPETYTLNSALKMFFDIETSKIGVISNFVFERTLSYEGYQQLLSDYNYGFLSKLWSNVAGFVSGQERNATYYLIYSEPGTEKALIGEGGQTDQENPGSIYEEEFLKPIGGFVKNIWEGAIDFLTGFSSNFKTILWIVLIAVVIIIGIKIFFTIKGNKNSRSKRK